MTGIVDAELLLYKSATVTETTSNGGRISSSEVVTGVAENVWPVITSDQRTDGDEVLRKLFFKVAHAGAVAFPNTRVALGRTTPAGSRVVIFSGTQRNTAADLTGSERLYGTGTLVSDVTAGGTTLVVDFEPGGGDDELVQDGDKLVLQDGTHREFVTVDTAGVSWSTDRATITLTAGTRYSYAAATPTYVGSCIVTASVVATVDNYAETGTFTFNEGAYPITPDGIGTVEQTWTLTFTSATAFGVSGDTVGSVGTGVVGSNFAPSNSAFSQPYFTIPAAAWGGSPVAGDTLVFQTHPAAVPFWAKLIIPAGTAADDTDQTKFLFYGG
jgi:hypothetical protein